MFGRNEFIKLLIMLCFEFRLCLVKALGIICLLDGRQLFNCLFSFQQCIDIADFPVDGLEFIQLVLCFIQLLFKVFDCMDISGLQESDGRHGRHQVIVCCFALTVFVRPISSSFRPYRQICLDYVSQVMLFRMFGCGLKEEDLLDLIKPFGKAGDYLLQRCKQAVGVTDLSTSITTFCGEAFALHGGSCGTQMLLWNTIGDSLTL